MIHPVNAFTPKVMYRGETDSSKDAVKKQTRKRLALINAAGISVILGAATTAIARSNTSSWKHASYFGLAAALVSMMFVGPGFLYKSGINVNSSNDKDVFAKEMDVQKKFMSDAGNITTAAKNTTKAAIKSMPKL